MQDSETYRGEKKNVGFSISTNGTQLGGVSAEYSKGKMTSDYTSVTEQAGLYAGAEGFDITTKGNTKLEGAVIDSKAKADKNKLSTNSLTVEDIKNKAKYKSSNTGLSYTSVSGFKNLNQAGKDAVYNSLGLLPKLLPDSEKSAESTTKSVIANGTITTESSNIDINKISKDTKNSLNKLDTIFDKKKVEERQELARLFAKDAFEQLHYWEPKTKEGKAAKALAHAVVAETSARIAGNPKGSGFYAGATNEALIGEIQKIAKSNPAVAQWLSASLGALVNHGLGKSPITGATEAQYGTKYNRFYKRRATIPVAGYIKKKDQETLNMYGLGIKKSYNGISENVSTDSEEDESYVGAPYIVSTWADADTGMAYHTLSDGTVQPMNKTWGKVLEGRGYPTALGNDGAFYTGSDEVGWYYNPNPAFDSIKNDNLARAMLKNANDSVNIELARLRPGTEQSINAFGFTYKVRAGDEPNTVYRTYGFGKSLNLTDALKGAGVIKEAMGDAFVVNNSQRSGIGLLGISFETVNTPNNSDIDLKSSRLKLSHTGWGINNDVRLKKVEDLNLNIDRPDKVKNHTQYNLSDYTNYVPVGTEIEVSKTYKVKSEVLAEDERLVQQSVPNMNLNTRRARALEVLLRDQGKIYINRNNGDPYFVITDKYGQSQLYTSSGGFAYIKNSILKSDYYEEKSDDK